MSSRTMVYLSFFMDYTLSNWTSIFKINCCSNVMVGWTYKVTSVYSYQFLLQYLQHTCMQLPYMCNDVMCVYSTTSFIKRRNDNTDSHSFSLESLFQLLNDCFTGSNCFDCLSLYFSKSGCLWRFQSIAPCPIVHFHTRYNHSPIMSVSDEHL